MYMKNYNNKIKWVVRSLILWDRELICGSMFQYVIIIIDFNLVFVIGFNKQNEKIKEDKNDNQCLECELKYRFKIKISSKSFQRIESFSEQFNGKRVLFQF